MTDIVLQQSRFNWTISANDFRPFSGQSIRGFLTLVIDPPGLVLEDAAWHARDGREWISLPRAAQINARGEVRRGANGAVLYTRILTFASSSAAQKFQEDALAAIRLLLGESS